MEESVSIPQNPDLKPSRDYDFLREVGLKHIEKLSSDIWTDYNIHDPGITILEILCYAITDLGYRTDHDIKDLLADQLAPSPGDAKQFHTARNILTSDPVTIQDYRKILIDVKGVKNAWLSPMKESMPPLYLNAEKGEWEQKPDDHNRRINLNGLYSITLELDEHEEFGDLNDYVFKIDLKLDEEGEENEELIVRLPGWSSWLNMGIRVGKGEQPVISLEDLKRGDDEFHFEASVEVEAPDGKIYKQKVKEIESGEEGVSIEKIRTRIEESIIGLYGNKLNTALKIGSTAYDRLQKNRSLCEDFEKFSGLDIEEIGVCADIELETDAVLEEVLADIYYQVEQHLAPPIYFYSLKEMMEKGMPTEEIFDGPPLNHGFISTEELAKADVKREIFISDILQIIMDVDGVKTVNNLMLNSAFGGEMRSTGVEWKHKVTEGRVPRLSREQSDIDLFKEKLPYEINTEKVDHYLKEKEELQRKRKLSDKEDYDLPIPEGEDRGLTQYTSIQHHMPLTYGMGDTGIPGKVTDLRRAQAKQLRAYLTFYDQLLVNYLAQLANLKNLFSFSSDLDRSYFYQVLFKKPEQFEFPGDDPIPEVMFSSEGAPRIHEILKEGEENFVKNLDQAVEDEQTSNERRNRFLNHLLARFGESFTDYVLLMYSREEGPRTASELIEDKTDFLKNYPSISASRGSGFNYKDEDEIWNTNNVSGFKKRVSRLLGIESYERRDLTADENSEERDEEGFHLIEHILLRPEHIDDPKLPACAQTKGRACPGYSDPYSFRISLIIPCWPERFDDMEFRRFVEKTIRREAPAHIHVKICWVDREDMKSFEKAYKRWLKIKSKLNPDPDELRDALDKIIDVMKSIHSTYPRATLHDFEEDDDNPMLLDNTALGKPKEEE